MIRNFNAAAGPSRYNNAPIIKAFTKNSDLGRVPLPRRRAMNPEQCLPKILPNIAFMQQEAKRLAPHTMLQQFGRYPSVDFSAGVEEDITLCSALGEAMKDMQPPRRCHSPVGPVSIPSASPSIVARLAFLAAVKKAPSPIPKQMSVTLRGDGRWKEPEPWQVLKAVETKDVMYLMEVRDRAFHLLLNKTGDATPLLHAMRIGASHRDMAIILIGAMSRFINNLEDEDMDKPETRVLLKALRTNLKLAINNSLLRDRSDLIASFLQTLIMSEGDRWLSNQVSQVSLALRAGPREGKPVMTAGEAVRGFATRELGKAKAIAALDDYVANATADLLMMAAWSMAQENIPDSEPLPLYHFARDDRVYEGFCARLFQHRSEIHRKVGKRLKRQMCVLERALEGKKETMRKKVQVVQWELDEERGGMALDCDDNTERIPYG
ncbi:hypothetical protein FRB95_012872 [Tulasnella sp. JGI-2019a]|nr:hypothetical protein FRB95_012872 [Tulasnella sp. JGI-2019a]